MKCSHVRADIQHTNNAEIPMLQFLLYLHFTQAHFNQVGGGIKNQASAVYKMRYNKMLIHCS